MARRVRRRLCRRLLDQGVSRQGKLLESFAVPARVRRGVPADLADRASLETRSLGELFEMTSVLVALGRGTDGSLVAVYFDETLTSKSARTARADVFVSVVSANLKKACVDLRSPVDTVSLPEVHVAGDTVLVVQQTLPSRASGRAAGEPETDVWKYAIDTSGCRWLPLRRSAPTRAAVNSR